MTPTTKKLLIGSLVLAGALTFSVLPALSSSPFDGPGQSGAASTSTTSVQASLLAEPLSVNNLLLTEANPTGAGLMFVGSSRLWWTTPATNGNAHCEWDNDFGISCASALQVGPGSPIKVDSLYSRQGDRPPKVDDSHGLALAPQNAVGTCGSTAAPRGAHVVLSDTTDDRLCFCLRVGSASQWVNGRCPATAGSDTACPACP